MPAPRILVVDDYDIVRQGVCAIISAQPGWEVCGEARTSEEGLRLAAELQPDIVVMDLLLPDLNGLDAARRLKKLLPEIGIVILSGHEGRELIQSVFDAGIRAFVFKTDARRHLAPAIAALLEGKPYLASGLNQVLLRQPAPHGAAGQDENRIEAALTAREREIIQCLAAGQSNKEVASRLSISIKTVETHRASIMRKLNLENLSDLVRYAIRKQIIEP
jgi:DNA-binding NarL/FixJ family response regulator